MTMHTWETYRCPCGAVGAVHTRENDQPYSANWEQTVLEGLAGSPNAPSCVACGQALDHTHRVPGRPADHR